MEDPRLTQPLPTPTPSSKVVVSRPTSPKFQMSGRYHSVGETRHFVVDSLVETRPVVGVGTDPNPGVGL